RSIPRMDQQWWKNRTGCNKDCFYSTVNMNFHTKGIVLRTVRYGETSVIVSIFTELFGMQSYIVNGVRSASRKAGTKSNLFQPTALLDLIVYHNEQKNLQRIKEHRWAVLYEHLFFDVFKGAVATYMVELLQKC